MTSHPKSTEPIFNLRAADRHDSQVGSLLVHDFKSTQGVISLRVPEHSIFRINSPVTTTDKWEGIRQRQVALEPADLQFLPGGTEISSVFVSRAYSETQFRIPHNLLQTAAAGKFDLSSADLVFRKIPHHECIGLFDAVRSLADAKARGLPVRDQVEDMITEAVVIALLDGFIDSRKWARQRGLEYRSPTGVIRAIELIEGAIDQPLTLTQMAEAAAMSTFHFCRTFKLVKGVTPMRYMWQTRLNRARAMLANKATPLAQIALDCGFSSQSNFTTAFKRLYGITPAQWRLAM